MLPLSNRYPWSTPPNRLARELEKLKMSGQKWVDLSISNPTQASLQLPDPFRISELLNQNYSPVPSGSATTRSAISAYYAEQFSVEVSPDRILLTTSTSEAYGYCFKLIAEPGASVLIPEPSYPLLRFLIEAEGLNAVPYPLHYSCGEWLLDREQLAKSCNSSTRAIVIVHPNNPTGHLMSDEDLSWLREFTRDRIWLISDEVFSDYIWASHLRTHSILQAGERNVFALSGMSKICALPQMKLGWIVMPADRQIQKNLELVADTYLSVSSPIQQAASCWLDQRHIFQNPIRIRCQQNLDLLKVTTAGSAWTALPVHAGWAAIVHGPAFHHEEGLAITLLEAGYSAHPGFYYDLPMEPAFVLSLLTPTEELQKGLEVITVF